MDMIKHENIEAYGGDILSDIVADAEAKELQLPEDKRINLRSPKDLAVVAKKPNKPIIREVVYSETGDAGSEPAGKGKHLLVVYDCF